MKKLGTATALTMTVCSLVVWAQGVRRDGQWEVKTEMSMPGVTMQMPATTSMQCVTKADVDNPAPPQGRGGPSDCKVSNYKFTGNKATFDMACSSPSAMTGASEIIYGVDKYDSTMTIQTSRGGQPMTMVMKSTAKRLGDCVK